MDIVARATQNSLTQALRVATKELPTKNFMDESKPEDTYKKLKKAMKKHILQLLADKSGYTAFQTLLLLQFELCSNAVLEDISMTHVDHLNFKMSRFILKRFNKLIKEEEEETHPFNYDLGGLEKILRSLEKILTNTYNLQENEESELEIDPRLNPCLQMSKTLMIALIDAYKSRDAVSEIEAILMSDQPNQPFYRSSILFTHCCYGTTLDEDL